MASPGDPPANPFLRSLLKLGISASVLSILYFILRSSLCKKLRRKLFTEAFVRLSSRRIYSALHVYKRDLFSQMNNIVSRDPILATGGPGVIRVLEIGIGNGANLKYYPKGCWLLSVEPNPYFEDYFKTNSKLFPDVNVESFLKGSAEDMSEIPSGSVDVVVSTHVLCSVTDVDQSLREIKRVLVDGGQFFCVEHVLYDPKSHPLNYFMQRILEPVWSLLSDDCKLTRDLRFHLNSAAFTHDYVREVCVHGVFHVMKPHLIGYLIK